MAAPDRGERRSFAGRLAERASQVEADEQRLAAETGVRPHLVFRVPLADGAPIDTVIERLEQAGLTIVSVDPDRAVIAFRDEGALGEFQEAIAAYGAGPREGRKTTKWDVLAFIEPEQMAALSPPDRIGSRLAALIGESAERIDPVGRYVVEVELWHPGSRDSARGLIAELTQYIGRDAITSGNGENRVTDVYVGETLCLAKAILTGQVLARVLGARIVAEVDLPPTPLFRPEEAQAARADAFSAPTPPDESRAARVCVVDSGIVAGHPLLSPFVGHAEAVLTAGGDAADMNGHGTRVAGLAVFGSVRQCYEDRRFESPILVFSARVLNDENQFDDELLIVNQMRRAIEGFRSPPHNCHVFNLSLGDEVAARLKDNGRQTRWAEELDVLARELEVVLVVSAGNVPVFDRRGQDAERLLRDYPSNLFADEAGVCDPATSAIAITVGAIAQSATPAEITGPAANAIVRCIAPAFHPSPFTRVGPGIKGAIKPEFVADGGNVVLRTPHGSRIGKEPGTAVMSLSHKPLERLFAYDVGTSYAAPVVSRAAAIVWRALRDQLGRDPHPNLVRAVLASSASVPAELAVTVRDVVPDAELRACGYGVVDIELAVASADRRVTLITESTMALDTVSVFLVPVPAEFIAAPGRKTISMALAFDPPVRRRRLDYLGVEMHFDLVRGKSLEEIAEVYRRLKAGEEAESFTPTVRPPLIPPASGRSGRLGRKKSTLQKGVFTFRTPRGSYGDSYYAVVRSERKPWLPPAIEQQAFALAVVLEGDAPQLYARVQQRVRQRTRARVR